MNYLHNRNKRMIQIARATPKVTRRAPIGWPSVEALAFTILAGFVVGLAI